MAFYEQSLHVFFQNAEGSHSLSLAPRLRVARLTARGARLHRRELGERINLAHVGRLRVRVLFADRLQFGADRQKVVLVQLRDALLQVGLREAGVVFQRRVLSAKGVKERRGRRGGERDVAHSASGR